MFHDPSTFFLFFLIDYYQTNFHFCILFGIRLHFYSLDSNYFSSPSFFFKAAGVAHQILSCSSFLGIFSSSSENSASYWSFILFMKLIPFFRSSKFVHTICLFSSSVHTLLFMVSTRLCSLLLALFAACCATVTLASPQKNFFGEFDYSDP